VSRYAEHACASGCHQILDSAGFAFESYDGLGAHRTVDEGQPVDARGFVEGPQGGRVDFRDAIELARSLSKDVGACIAVQWFRSLVRRPELPGEGKALEDLARRFDPDVREMLVSMVLARLFRYRAPAAGEVLR
jgi:hypothetical protein